MPKCEPVIDAAYELLKFTKHNEFPEINTVEFFKLTQLLDNLETMMLKYNWIGPGSFQENKD